MNKKTYLPVPLVEQIEKIELTRIQKGKAYKLMDDIIRKGIQGYSNFSAYIPCPQNYFRNRFGDGRYHSWLDPLKNAGILEVETNVNTDGVIVETYYFGPDSDRKNYCKSYRIRPDLISANVIEVSYDTREEDYLIIGNEHCSRQLIYDDLSLLKVDRDKLLAITEQKVASICATDFKVNEEITDKSIDIGKRKDDPIYISLNYALGMAKAEGVDLIKDKRTYHFETIDEYIPKKKEHIAFSYRRTILRLFEGDFYANRNKTNSRLDHNLTSTPSILLEVIKEDNDLVELDLSNSQFAILAWQMGKDDHFIKTDDFLLFRKYAVAGQLYEFVQKCFKLKERQEAKTILFELLFSKYGNCSIGKSELKKLFPSVVEYVDNYKKNARATSKRKDGEFAVWLQKEESRMFVDDIYYQLKKQGLWLLTRHDSLLFKREDIEIVESHVSEYFKSIQFECKFQIK